MPQTGFIDLKHRYEDLDATGAALGLTIAQGIVEAHGGIFGRGVDFKLRCESACKRGVRGMPSIKQLRQGN